MLPMAQRRSCCADDCCTPAPTGPTIRTARADDAAQVIELERAAHVEIASDPAEFIVAEQDGRVIACARLRPYPDGTFEIASVAVDPALRGNGIGAKLVKAVLANAEGPVHALAVAPRFFLQLGFRPVADAPAALRPKLDGECATRKPTLLLWTPSPEQIQRTIRQRYGSIALAGRPRAFGDLAPGAYAPDELNALPEGAWLALGTGHPVRAANLQPGETVVDLGSGAGVDVLLAARQIGPAGRAIGIDFTPEMIARARDNAASAGLANATFLQAPIEAIPLPANSADAITSNCVINLSTDKNATLAEALRILRPGGRLVVSDTLRLHDAPPSDAPSCDCTTGAMSAREWDQRLRAAGFTGIQITPEPPAHEGQIDPCCGGPSIGRVLVQAVKPA